MRARSPTGLTCPAQSGWKRAFVYGSSTYRWPLRTSNIVRLHVPYLELRISETVLALPVLMWKGHGLPYAMAQHNLLLQTSTIGLALLQQKNASILHKKVLITHLATEIDIFLKKPALLYGHKTHRWLTKQSWPLIATHTSWPVHSRALGHHRISVFK